MTLFYYDEQTGSFSPEEEPSPYTAYYTFDVETNEFVSYEPTPADWSVYYELPSVQTYYWDEPTSTYNEIEVSELSPYETYYTWDQQTHNYFTYVPTEVSWSNHYEIPSETIYTYEESTQSYSPVEELSPYEEYYTYDVGTATYYSYAPSPIAESVGYCAI